MEHFFPGIFGGYLVVNFGPVVVEEGVVGVGVGVEVVGNFGGGEVAVKLFDGGG